MLEDLKNDMTHHYEMTFGIAAPFPWYESYTNKEEHLHSSSEVCIEAVGEIWPSMGTPLAAHDRLCKNDGSEAADESEHRKLVRSLLYLSATRPDIMFDASLLADIMFDASLLARLMHDPTKKHM